jgi:two-component system sensor histidine kinase KdpD
VQQAQKTALVVESDRLRMALFNSVSHELRTPLASITGAVSTLLDGTIDYSEKARTELLESILYGSMRMERIVTNLLDTARQESGMLKLKTDWCDIEDIVGTALRRIGKTRKTHLLTTKIQDRLPLFRGDCVLLEQVLVNLLDNAMKYSPEGSTITITACLDGGRIILSVIDQGFGIALEDMKHIFEKFYRAPQMNKVAGTGLGLSICRGIIEAHNGRIWAENHQGGGAEFSFSLPVEQAGSAVMSEEGE